MSTDSLKVTVVILVLLLNSKSHSQSITDVVFDNFAHHSESGIYIYAKEALCVVKYCEPVYKPSIQIKEGKYSNTYYISYSGDSLDLDEVVSTNGVKLIFQAEIENHSKLYSYRDEYGDAYELLHYQHGDSSMLISFWKGYRGDYFLYEYWSTSCPLKEDFYPIVKGYLKHKNYTIQKEKILNLQEVQNEKEQNFIKKAMKLK
ncbi:MAG: hypothetical protein P1U56_13530 [Saprospiraceae bacterium]|nr:hypothetical protein [Saprospiraceae bacterium]